MATINYRLHSTDNNKVVPIYCLVSLNREKRFEVKTGYYILTKDWSAITKLPKQNDEENKILYSKLNKLKNLLFDKINSIDEDSNEISKEWVLETIKEFRGEKVKNETDLLLNHIQYVIDTANTRENQKKGTGLSEGRIKIYRTFLGLITTYEKHLKTKIYIKDIDIKFAEKFKLWLFSLKYSVNSVGKNISLLKTVCNDAEKLGIETSTQLKNIKVISESKSPDEIIYLNLQELEAIEKLDSLPSHLENTRNWLILGCYLGQRGGDLMRVNKQMIKEIQGVKIIEIQQEKTGKLVAIPLLPKALNILENKELHSISLQKFNDYVKILCKKAEIIIPTKGSKIDPDTKKKIKGVFPKYELIGSHVCRRSFASNFYGEIPTPILINVTGHSSETMFLKYIGKTSYDNAFAMIEHFAKFEQKDKITEN